MAIIKKTPFYLLEIALYPKWLLHMQCGRSMMLGFLGIELCLIYVYGTRNQETA